MVLGKAKHSQDCFFFITDTQFKMAADQTEPPTQFCRLRIYFLFDAF